VGIQRAIDQSQEATERGRVMERNCSACVHKSSSGNGCNLLSGHCTWQPKEAPMERACRTCQFNSRSYTKMCNSCSGQDGFPMWGVAPRLDGEYRIFNGNPHWLPKDGKKVEQNCITCKWITSYPSNCAGCSGAGNFPHWQPKEEPMNQRIKMDTGRMWLESKPATKTTIKIIRPVTIASVAAENPPRKVFDNLYRYFDMGKFTYEISAKELEVYFGSCGPYNKEWFLSHGFIEEVEEREKIGVGSLWRHEDGEIYRLIQCDVGRMVLVVEISDDEDMGNRWTSPVEVTNHLDISGPEWDKITRDNSSEFSRLHGRMEYVEDNDGKE